MILSARPKWIVSFEMTDINPLKPPVIGPNDHLLQWSDLSNTGIACAISNLAATHDAPVLVITPDVQTSQIFYDACRFFTADSTIPLLRFPGWETLPYDPFSPHQDLISERLLTLYRLPSLKRGIIISDVCTLMQRLCPRSYLDQNTFILKTGDSLPLTEYRERLVRAGYHSVGQVMEHGEFAQRGGIIDVFPMGSPFPYRIELFDDEVNSIRSFDPESQRTLEKIPSIQLLPAREYPLNDESIQHFRHQWREKFTGNPLNANTYEHISNGEPISGVESFLPFFFLETTHFLDYLNPSTVVVLPESLDKSASEFWKELRHRYEQLRYDVENPICAPKDLYYSYDEFRSLLKKHTQIARRSLNLHRSALPNVRIDYKSHRPLTHLEDFLSTYGQKGRVLLTVESAGRRETLLKILRDANISPKLYEGWKQFLSDTSSLGITIANLQEGFVLPEERIALISENQLFGEQVKQERLRHTRRQDPYALIRNLTELSIGDPVVHIQHGIGRYLGLQVIATNQIEGEYLTLQYADNDKIYVPISSLHLISRYTDTNAEHAPLTKLGTKHWDKIKSQTQKRIRDVAAELLDIYVRRQNAKGYAFHIPNEFKTFRNAFPFEETPDQQAAIEEVLKDMSSAKTMDRIICGDVGFGKTEVAMQAAFICVSNHKQVAVLVPTTLLAEQHLNNFQDRFADWPVQIRALSRLRSTQQRHDILNKCAGGKIDILIGTHQLLSQNMKFKDLGLLIIDEEHRFGVRQKERLKALRAQVDILTLTATPIPRTLNMSLSGIRDLSLIATPPERRLSVKTFVREYNTSLIREAIHRETFRGGQVYFLHNDLATIDATCEKLKQIVPEARIAVAHGQMRERELERVMSDFYHRKFNVLLCSTIIESGIDVPTANTIIINQAHRFGLAQLHQLRGRVGRSHHQAYAYLLIPSWKSITSNAQKRLEVISDLNQLGIGFNLATHDLEIRGAGELLGTEQSGHMHEVGFSLYMEMLEEAVSALKAGKDIDFEKPLSLHCDVDLGISALLPTNYIHDVNLRLTLYKRLANCSTVRDIEQLQEELIDRFGSMPTVAKHCFDLAEIQLQAQQLGIQKIAVGSEYGYIYFNPEPKIHFEKLIESIQRDPKRYQLQKDALRFSLKKLEAADRIQDLKNLLKTL